ncbi:MAG: FAD:protein FMN transferase, partial [Actinobacteria bacterium]|nr:FAD:protein FMN transferase [Actinomycetota bacterium]
VLSATVIAPTGADADALATALYVLGPEGLARVAPRGGEVSAALVVPGRSASNVRVLTANLASDAFQVVDAPGIEIVESV